MPRAAQRAKDEGQAALAVLRASVVASVENSIGVSACFRGNITGRSPKSEKTDHSVSVLTSSGALARRGLGSYAGPATARRDRCVARSAWGTSPPVALASVTGRRPAGVETSKRRTRTGDNAPAETPRGLIDRVWRSARCDARYGPRSAARDRPSAPRLYRVDRLCVWPCNVGARSPPGYTCRLKSRKSERSVRPLKR